MVAIFIGKTKGESNISNATVRWTVARCGLDRIDTSYNRFPSASSGKCIDNR